MKNWLQSGTVRIARLHFVFTAIYAIIIIPSDAWHLITPKVVLQRWTVAALMLVATTLLWYAARTVVTRANYYRAIVFSFILLDILVAAFSVYTQRGMASRAVMLFSIPIGISAILLSRTALYATASLSVAAYVLAAMRYFIVYPGEGYKTEFYVEVGFYCAMFYLLAALLWAILRSFQKE